MARLLSDLLQHVANVRDVVPALQVSAMTLDSRAVTEGALFVALKGSREHGLTYATQAVELGAAAIIWDYEANIKLPALPVPVIGVDDLPASLGGIAACFYDHSGHDLQIVGITGTDGKTSVSHFLAQAMNVSGGACAVIGTLGIGHPGALEKATHTTPDVISVHQSLQRLSRRGSRCVAMEVSSHALDQQRVAGVAFDVAILTNLTRDHLDYHGTVEAYAAAKAKLFLEYAPKTAVLNLNDAFGKTMFDALANQPVNTIGYAIGEPADYPVGTLLATEPHYDHQGLQAMIHWQGQVCQLSVGVLGDFNLSNLLAAMGGMLGLGYRAADAIAALSQVTTVAGRIEKIRIDQAQSFLSVVDYAHTPGALSSVLSALRVHCRGRLICVFGCGGDRDAGKRPLMAQVAEAKADVVIATDDNPRNEDPKQIMQGIVSGFEHPEAVTIEHDRAAAIRLAIQQAKAGDVVLVAGKGHEQAQIIQGVAHAFDDREQIRLALKDLKPAVMS